MKGEAIREILSRLGTAPSDALESEVLEFKEFTGLQALHNSKELAEEVSALANASGGSIIVGVRSSSNVKNAAWTTQLVGFPESDPLEIQERLKGKLAPKIPLTATNISYGGKNFLLIEVPRHRDSLVTTSSGKVYVRDGRTSRPMSPEEIESAVKALPAYDWSAEDIDLSVAEALDPDAIQAALSEFQRLRSLAAPLSAAAFLEAIGATKNGNLTKGGLLFLGRAQVISSLLGDYEYRFTWRTRGAQLLKNDVWSDCLWNSIARARAHFKASNMIIPLEFEGKTYEAPALDPQAFHEAFLNALVHRDYSVDGMVSVTYSDSQMKITSPGGFYGGVTAENILRHEPRHRNKALARLLMTFNLVDRAGMGVLRMSLRSLLYGRRFPEFKESLGNVEVSMEAEHIRPGVFVMSVENEATYGIPELLVLNSVYDAGVVSVEALLQRLHHLSSDPWGALREAVGRIPEVELCGTRAGIFIRVVPAWTRFFAVTKIFRPSKTSKKHVKLYSYLRKHGEASNRDLTDLLRHSYSSQTSRFLREAQYVKRRGTGPSARWSLNRP